MKIKQLYILPLIALACIAMYPKPLVRDYKQILYGQKRLPFNSNDKSVLSLFGHSFSVDSIKVSVKAINTRYRKNKWKVILYFTFENLSTDTLKVNRKYVNIDIDGFELSSPHTKVLDPLDYTFYWFLDDPERAYNYVFIVGDSAGYTTIDPREDLTLYTVFNGKTPLERSCLANSNDTLKATLFLHNIYKEGREMDFKPIIIIP